MNDPVLVRRARMGRLAVTGKRLGYLAFLSAIALFTVGMVGNFSDGIATACSTDRPPTACIGMDTASTTLCRSSSGDRPGTSLRAS